jgi:protein-export chaperone SecB
MLATPRSGEIAAREFTAGASNMTTQNGGQPAANAPGLGILGQYVKDLSFENPNAPQSLMVQPEQPPAVDVQINVNAKPMAETDYEVEIKIEVRAEDKKAKRVLFNLELAYAGVFRITNVAIRSAKAAFRRSCCSRWISRRSSAPAPKAPRRRSRNHSAAGAAFSSR